MNGESETYILYSLAEWYTTLGWLAALKIEPVPKNPGLLDTFFQNQFPVRSSRLWTSDFIHESANIASFIEMIAAPLPEKLWTMVNRGREGKAWSAGGWLHPAFWPKCAQWNVYLAEKSNEKPCAVNRRRQICRDQDRHKDGQFNRFIH